MFSSHPPSRLLHPPPNFHASLPHPTNNFGPKVIVQEGYSRPQEGKRGRVGATKHTSSYTIPLPIPVCGPLGRGPLPFLLPPSRFPIFDCTRRLESSLSSCSCIDLSCFGILPSSDQVSIPWLVSSSKGRLDSCSPVSRIITCPGPVRHWGLRLGRRETRTGRCSKGKPSIPVVPLPVEASLSPLFAFLVWII
jgi:hypothetical protein